VFVARVKQILDEVYTEERYGKFIDDLAARLEEEVKLRAKLRGERPEAGAQLLAHNVGVLKLHLNKRREWLLAQKELGGKGVAGQDVEERGPGATPQPARPTGPKRQID
jgi:hypothetical protein